MSDGLPGDGNPLDERVRYLRIRGRPTADIVRRIFWYDEFTGNLIYRQRIARNVHPGLIAGRINVNGYRDICVDERSYRAHRIIWLYKTGRWPAGVIDHIDGDRLNNRWCNLRDVSPAINVQNQRRASKRSSTGFLGVYYHERSRGFIARIFINGIRHQLGVFRTKEAAHDAYVLAKRRLHPGCTI